MSYNEPKYTDVKRGEIYYINNEANASSVGSEQTNNRPAIIVSNDVGNKHSGIVEIVYLTTQPKKHLPTHVDIYTTTEPSTALCEQITTVSKFRLDRYINECSQQEMEDIDRALAISLGLSKVTKGMIKYLEKWDKMLEEENNITIEDPPVIPAESCGDNLFSNEDVAYIATLETQLGLYKKFYEDTHELLKLSIGGSK